MKETILKWIGGKNDLAEDIIKLMPHHTTYVEVFTGSATIFLQKPLCKINVLNDLNGNLINLYKVVNDSDKKDLLKELLNGIVYSRELFETFLRCYRHQDMWFKTEQVTKALMYLYINKCSFNGQFNNYARRDDSANVYELQPIITKMFRKFQAGKCVFEKLSFEDLLATDGKLNYDRLNTFIYLDPPYWVTTQPGNAYYEKLMSVSEHKLLAEMMKKHKKAKWLMSYDDVPEVRRMYGLPLTSSDYQFQSVDGLYGVLTRKMHQSSASLSEEQVYKQEILISNYNLETNNTLFNE